MLAQDRRVRLISAENPPDMATLRNRAVLEATGEVMVMLDGDLIPQDPSWLREMVSQALRPGVGLVGCRIFEEEGANIGLVLNAQSDLIPIEALDQGGHGVKALLRTISAVPSACMAFRRAAFLAAGSLQAGIAARDAAIGLAQRMHGMGLRHIHSPFAKLHRASPAPQVTPDWQTVTADPQPAEPPESHGEDPHYNPNLALDGWFDHAATPSRRVKPWEARRRPDPAIRLAQVTRASWLIGHLPKGSRCWRSAPATAPSRRAARAGTPPSSTMPARLIWWRNIAATRPFRPSGSRRWISFGPKGRSLTRWTPLCMAASMRWWPAM
jgi:hypothetical protein